MLTAGMIWAALSLIAAVSCIYGWLLSKFRRPSKKNLSLPKEEVVITDLAKPRLPLPIRGYNFIGKFFPLKELTVDAVVMEAQRRTKLWECLDEHRYPFRDGLKRLVQDYNDHKNRLTRFGRLCLRSAFVRMVANNLNMAEQIKKHPEILTESVVSPVFIIGPPRTGSSHLHDTLSQHPVFRTPKHLELLHPVLKEEQFSLMDADPRETVCNAYLSFLHYLRPYLSVLHDIGPYVSEEDILMTGIIFRSIIFGTMFPCKEYMQWFGEVDHTTVYEFLKLALQLLQWQDVQMGRPRRRWLLKSPDHSFSLPCLMKVFPDATIIQTHRDMSAVLPSYLNLVVYVHGIFNDVVDLRWTGEWWTAWFEFVLHRFVKDQSNMKGQVVNVLFRDLVSNDLSVVMQILSFLGICVDEVTHQQLEQYVAAHKRHSKGRVIYNGSVFGLKQQSLRDRFSAYHKTFRLVDIDGKPE